MKIIVGLGNPGTKYERNRHNTGFMAIDFLIGNWKLEIGNCQNNFNCKILQADISGQKIVLAIPQTFMNLSGEAVKAIGDFYKIDYKTDLLVIHDEVDLPFGEIRTTDSSSAAGHNGVQNIIDLLGTKDFHRIRVGVENREDKKMPPTEAFVLQNFSDDEIKELQTEIFPQVKLEIEKFILR